MAEKIPTYIGWYRPHAPVRWTGEVLDRKTGELIKEPSMTKQEFVAECDINNVIRSYQVTGIMAHLNERAAQGLFLDLPDPMDYQEALNMAQAASAAFAALPSAVRNRFENDPAQFLAFMQDPANTEEAIKLGLAKAPPEPPVPPPSPTAPPAPPATPSPEAKPAT